jgi:effector-binding domain-containing protein
MLEIPRITRTFDQLTAVIHLTVPRCEIQTVMGPGVKELMEALETQGITPGGPWFNHHLRIEPDIFDFEISVPVASPVEPVGRVKPSRLPGAVVARTVYHGGYEGLADAWGEFMTWIFANGHRPGNNLWECYVLGPESSLEPSDWRTEFNLPLAEVAAKNLT